MVHANKWRHEFPRIFFSNLIIEKCIENFIKADRCLERWWEKLCNILCNISRNIIKKHLIEFILLKFKENEQIETTILKEIYKKAKKNHDILASHEKLLSVLEKTHVVYSNDLNCTDIYLLLCQLKNFSVFLFPYI